MAKFYFLFVVLVMGLSAQANTKVYFQNYGEFVISDNASGRVVTRQNYIIKSLTMSVLAETESKKKAFGQWKNCYKSKNNEVEFPIPFPVPYYTPFTEVHELQLSTFIDQHEKTVTFDENQIIQGIQRASNSLNNATSGKCTILSKLLIRVYVQSEDGLVNDSILLAIKLKKGKLNLEFTDVKVISPNHFDMTETRSATLPNFSTPVTVFGS